MSSSEEEGTRVQYESVCADLNMDEQTTEAAWRSYEVINNDYVLEVSYVQNRERWHNEPGNESCLATAGHCIRGLCVSYVVGGLYT